MSSDGWKAPQTDQEIWWWLRDKHGDDSYTREIDRRWRRLGKLIEHGPKVRIRDGYLGR